MSTINQAVPLGAVVVGVDGSQASLRALEAALEVAALERRPVHVVHSYTAYPPALGPTLMVGDLAAEIRAQAAKVVEIAREHAELVRPEVDLTAGTSLSDPREKLAELSERASLVVVGSRGLGGVRGLLLGSVSLWVTRHAACPVLVVRPANDVSGAGVLVGADGSERSLPAVEKAFAVASMRDLPLTVMHCLPPVPYRGPESVPLSEELDELPLHRLEVAESVGGMREKYPDVALTTQITRGPASRHLVEGSTRSALVVVGSHHHRGPLGLLGGGTTRVVVEHAHCPVLVVPDGTGRR